MKNNIIRAPRLINGKPEFAYWIQIGNHEIGVNNLGLARQLQLPCPKKVRKNSEKK